MANSISSCCQVLNDIINRLQNISLQMLQCGSGIDIAGVLSNQTKNTGVGMEVLAKKTVEVLEKLKSAKNNMEKSQ